MKLLDKKTSADAVRLLIFLVVTSLATGVLVIMIGNLSFKAASDYQAQFVDVTGVIEGDDVRIAGVKVGSVKKVEVVDRDRALVTFSVEEGITLSDSTFATIRFRNLVGQRYISLTEEVGDTSELEPGDTIPVERTKPALDLTLLFNGFKPLFQALSPDDINQFSYEIVQVFQGEGGTLESLLQSTASVTATLADRDQVIGDLLENLDYVLDRLADRDEQLTALITSFRELVGGLKTDRFAILDSIEGISRLSVQTADLLEGIRPPFVEDIKQLRRFARNTDENKEELDRALQVLPIKLNKVGRTAIDGSWFNFYLCSFRGKVSVPGLNQPIFLPSEGGYQNGAERCRLGSEAG
jgi:phospholipid/cholesterol/gamma-HCH transport system substrate-binding protein